MFGNKGKEETTTYVPPAPVHTSSGKQEITTLLSEGCRFEGNMFAPSNTRIDGEVKGNVNGQSMLVVGEKGKITGDLNAVDVVVYGQVEGNIKSHKLDLKKGCRVTGDVYVDTLITEAGVLFNGKSNMESPKQGAQISENRAPKVSEPVQK
jgi:cytoskeletal protein CcmA (bactofilin family)